MDLKARIRRRQRAGEDSGVVLDYEAVSPVTHPEEPTGRGPVIEQLLDYFDPVFDGRLPTDAYVWGPAGSGKSTVMTSLIAQLSRLVTGAGPVIHTSTRARTADVPDFVYVDARRAGSAFGLYHAVLDGLVEEPIPREGVGTDALRSRLVDYLRTLSRTAVVVVDHVEEPGGLDLGVLSETFSPVEGSLACIPVGRTPPGNLGPEEPPPEHIEVPAYERHALADILMVRASDGLTQQATNHEQIRRLSEWAEGNAHDALAALFGAADLADTAGRDRIRERDLTAGMDAVPRPSASLGRVVTLPDNRQLVLRRLVDLGESATESVDAAAGAIADAPDVDLSAATVKRFLYELAEEGIVERVSVPDTRGAGRPPSRLEPRFPTLVFRRLYDLERS